MKTPIVLALLITFTICSCQKEIPILQTAKKIEETDSLKAIVFDGDYPGNTFNYDSAVIRYGTNTATILHYNRPSVLQGSETFFYDASGRVVSYRLVEPQNQYYSYRHYQYENGDSLPTIMVDSSIDGMDYIGRYVVTKKAVAGGKRTLSISETNTFIQISNVAHNKSEAVFNSNGRLVHYADSLGFVSNYFYSSFPGDLDSTRSFSQGNADEAFFGVEYDTASNPLINASKLLYKNLQPFAVTGALNNFGYEAVLNICYLPSEFLASKLPFMVGRINITPGAENETDYTYHFLNKKLTVVAVTGRDYTNASDIRAQMRLYY